MAVQDIVWLNSVPDRPETILKGSCTTIAYQLIIGP